MFNLMSVTLQIPFKHDSLLVDKKELKLTKAEKREAKRGIKQCSLLAIKLLTKQFINNFRNRRDELFLK